MLLCQPSLLSGCLVAQLLFKHIYLKNKFPHPLLLAGAVFQCIYNHHIYFLNWFIFLTNIYSQPKKFPLYKEVFQSDQATGLDYIKLWPLQKSLSHYYHHLGLKMYSAPTPTPTPESSKQKLHPLQKTQEKRSIIYRHNSTGILKLSFMTNLQLEELNDALAHKVFVLPSSRGKKHYKILRDWY